MGQYLPILALLVLAVVFVVISLMASKLLAPQRPTPAKLSPYECGIIPGRDTPERFPVRFYLVAMIFIVFDIEIIFFFPYAITYRELSAFGLGSILIFAAAVFESFVYLIGNGAFEWGPAQRLRRTSTQMSRTRTTRTTVRRVGLEGRPDEPVDDAELAEVVA